MTPAEWVLLVAIVLFGLAIGSFTCVIIDRLPFALEEPDQYGDSVGIAPWREVLGGTSRCSSCGEGVRPRDNIPVVSWLLLRGKCRGCGEKIPAFHPIVELSVPVIAVGLMFGIGREWLLLPALIFVAPAVAIAAIDFRWMIVPTKLVWPTFFVVVPVCVAVALVQEHPRWLLGALLGLAVLAGPLFAIFWVYPQGMGFGDVRLSVLLGWMIGFAGAYFGASLPVVAVLVLVAVVASSIIGIVLGLMSGRGSRQVPFGPPLILAALLAIGLARQFVEPFV
ncbi:MAG: prepilin peptidase [Microthrixaceae bacterium]